MPETIVDMPKVMQMLDSGWLVRLAKNHLHGYSAWAWHEDVAILRRVRDGLIEQTRRRASSLVAAGGTIEEFVDDFHYDDGWLMTDDFTPEQALTRLAYKVVGGEIL